VSQPFHFELLADAIKALNAVHQDVLLVSPENESPEAYERKIASRTADGIIFLGVGTRVTLLRELALTSTPFVAWGAPDPGAAYCTVGSDNALGGRLAAERFVALDRKQVLFVGPLEHNEIRLRRHGLALGLQAAGGDRQLQELVPADLAFGSSQDAFAAYLAGASQAPDAIFCASDTIAMAVLSVLRATGMRVPEDVSVIGYDDIPSAAEATPAITTIRQDTALAADLLVENLQKRIAGEFPTSVLMPTSLIVRET
jgi:DNA-binding LacI/PurR family transcriptional regulator